MQHSGINLFPWSLVQIIFPWWCYQWKQFPRYWPFGWGIHRSPVHFPHKGHDTELRFFFDLHLNKRLSKQTRRRWFKTPSSSLCRHHDAAIFNNLCFCRFSARLSVNKDIFCYDYAVVRVRWQAVFRKYEVLLSGSYTDKVVNNTPYFLYKRACLKGRLPHGNHFDSILIY